MNNLKRMILNGKSQKH